MIEKTGDLSLNQGSELGLDWRDLVRIGQDNGNEAGIEAFFSSDLSSIDNSISSALNIEDLDIIPRNRISIIRTIQNVIDGTPISVGAETNIRSTSNLMALHESYLNNPNAINLNTRSGYAAEIISTAYENLMSHIYGTGDVSYRIDDLPTELRAQFGDRFRVANDTLVDRIIIHSDNTYTTIQTKFLGSTAAECFSQLMSGSVDRYFDVVDLIEIPNDFYDEIMDRINTELNTCTDEVQLNRLSHLRDMLYRSPITRSEALEAVIHPRSFAWRMFNQQQLHIARLSIVDGVRNGAAAAALTTLISGVSDIVRVCNGEMTPKGAFMDVAGDAILSGTMVTGTTFVSNVIARNMSLSANTLIRRVGGSWAPAAAVTCLVEIADDVIDYSRGIISGEELAHSIGRDAIVTGAAFAGGSLGSAVGPVGSFAGSILATVLATTAYEAAVEYVPEVIAETEELYELATERIADISAPIVEAAVDNIEIVATDVSNAIAEGYTFISEASVEIIDNIEVAANQIIEHGNEIIDFIRTNVPEQIDNAIEALNEFASSNNLPFSFGN